MLRDRRAWRACFESGGSVGGAAVLTGIEMAGGRKPREPVDKAVMKDVYLECVRRGLLAMTYSPHIRLQPALTIDRAAAAEALGILGEVFERLGQSARWR